MTATTNIAVDLAQLVPAAVALRSLAEARSALRRDLDPYAGAASDRLDRLRGDAIRTLSAVENLVDRPATDPEALRHLLVELHDGRETQQHLVVVELAISIMQQRRLADAVSNTLGAPSEPPPLFKLASFARESLLLLLSLHRKPERVGADLRAARSVCASALEKVQAAGGENLSTVVLGDGAYLGRVVAVLRTGIETREEVELWALTLECVEIGALVAALRAAGGAELAGGAP
jgi:hypothetical protein